MGPLQLSITINAPKEKVWEVMLTDETYREWSDVFMPGTQSHFVGSWEKGSKIQFLSSQDGKMGGMTSQIEENKPYEEIVIHHLGVVADGVEDTTSEDAKKWEGFEKYTFTSTGEETTVTVSLDTPEDYRAYFEEAWNKALQKIKEIAERNS